VQLKLGAAGRCRPTVPYAFIVCPDSTFTYRRNEDDCSTKNVCKNAKFAAFVSQRSPYGDQATGWIDPSFEPRRGQEVSLFLKVQRGSAFTQRFNKYQCSLQGVNRPKNEAYHIHLVPRLRMSRSYTSLFPTCLYGVDRKKKIAFL
jgi:hypothetical protein